MSIKTFIILTIIALCLGLMFNQAIHRAEFGIKKVIEMHITNLNIDS